MRPERDDDHSYSPSAEENKTAECYLCFSMRFKPRRFIKGGTNMDIYMIYKIILGWWICWDRTVCIQIGMEGKMKM